MNKLLIGVGNEDRCDDGVGLYIARHMSKKGLSGLKTREHRGEGLDLMDVWKDVPDVILVDAVSSEAQPGHIYRLNVHDKPLPNEFFRCSTHNFGLAEAVEMARALNELPRSVVIYGIEGNNFGPGRDLSKEVKSAADTVIQHIEDEIRQGGICHA